MKIYRRELTQELSDDPRAAAVEALSLGYLPAQAESYLTLNLAEWRVEGEARVELCRWMRAELLEEEPSPAHHRAYMGRFAPRWERISIDDLPAKRWVNAEFYRDYSRGARWTVIIDGNDYYPSVGGPKRIEEVEALQLSDTVRRQWEKFELLPKFHIWRDVDFTPRKGFETLTEQYVLRRPEFNAHGPYWGSSLLHRI